MQSRRSPYGSDSQENHRVLTRLYIEPKWGAHTLSSVRTVQVEEWLDSLPLVPASKTKIRSTFSVLYSHAIRQQWLTFNPISKVRTSSMRLREKDVLTPLEFHALVAQLSVRDRVMVLLAGSTGLRRSEMIALTWTDLDTTRWRSMFCARVFAITLGTPRRNVHVVLFHFTRLFSKHF